MNKNVAGLLAATVLLTAGCIVAVPPPQPQPQPQPVYAQPQPQPVYAQPVAAPQHPSYLRALEDLRHSRAHLEQPANSRQTAWDQNVAVREIDAAMNEIRQASIDDGKNLSNHPPVDMRMDWEGRLHRSLELLESARQDCAQEEDNGFARGMRGRALQHIDAAIRFVQQGIAANGYRQPPPPVYAQQPAPPPPVYAQPAPQQHPSYLHALEDLRHSRAHLERPANVARQTAWDENVAIREIDVAMKEIRDASIDDGKSLGDHPPVDARMDWSGRLHRSLELLQRARQDCTQEEDNGYARGLQGRAIQHIDAAIRFVQQGIDANHSAPPPPIYAQPAPPPAQPVFVQPAAAHPSYLHALEDLRHSRAHLERPANVNMHTAWDERVAIHEIDAAMNEIRQASIDDRKNINDHPPVDARMDWGGRLHRTVDLLRKARQDCTQEEDNGFARGLQGRAIQHIDAAIRFVEQGIASNHY